MSEKSIVFAIILLLSVQLAFGAMEDPNPPADDNCCSKCGSCDPEFSPAAAVLATIGVFFIAFFIRWRMKP